MGRCNRWPRACGRLPPANRRHASGVRAPPDANVVPSGGLLPRESAASPATRVWTFFSRHIPLPDSGRLLLARKGSRGALASRRLAMRRPAAGGGIRSRDIAIARRVTFAHGALRRPGRGRPPASRREAGAPLVTLWSPRRPFCTAMRDGSSMALLGMTLCGTWSRQEHEIRVVRRDVARRARMFPEWP